MKQKLKKLKNKIKPNEIIEKNKFAITCILLFSLFAVSPLLGGKIHIGDDMYYHIVNIEAYAKGLPFSMFAKIMPELGNNLGFGIGIFYPALPHIFGAFISSILSIFGRNMFATTLVMYFLIYFLSGLSMYFLGKKIFQSHLKGLIASLFYITYNYFFVDVFIRSAINEAFMFIFMPLILLGLYYLFNERNIKKFYILVGGGYICLMYSHLVMSVYFTLFLIIFLLFYIKDVLKKDNFKHLCLVALIILILTSTFWVPLLQHNLNGNYVAFENHNWTSTENIWSMPFSGFFTEYNYPTTHNGLIYSNLNFIVIFFLILAIITLFKKTDNQKQKKFIIAISMFVILGILLNAIKIIWLYSPQFLRSIQYIWRLSIFVGFGSSLVATYGFSVYLNWFKKKYLYIGTLIIILFLGYFTYCNILKTEYQTGLDYTIDYGTVREDFPVKTYYDHYEYYKEKDENEITILKGNAKTKIIENNVPYLKFKITNLKETSIIELPRLYYLGYQIKDDKGNIVDYKEDKYGFISIEVTKNGIYTVKYTGTTAYKIALVVKILTIIFIIGYVVYNKRKNNSVYDVNPI